MYKYSGNSLLGHRECVIVLITRESSFRGTLSVNDSKICN